LETRALALVTDPSTNEVVGVKAECQGGILYFKANKGVVLSAGGFGQNKEMCKTYCPNALYGVNYTASDTGDGILMGMAIGASAVNMDRTLLGTSIPAGAILVNRGGRRFVDESLYQGGAKEWTGQSNSLAFAIFDEEIRKTTSLTTTIQAPTVGELAQKIGMDPTVLEDTVNFYNRSVDLGKDLEFGRVRRRHGDPPASLLPVKTPPFHAVRRDSNNFTATITMGGLRTNTKAQVIDVYGKLIPRLYAAGMTSGGLLGEMYPGSGSAIAQALTFGRIAGQNVATEPLLQG
jgi:succinate dehydrogenase/fumarate reductase flavoprotein subunit